MVTYLQRGRDWGKYLLRDQKLLNLYGYRRSLPWYVHELDHYNGYYDPVGDTDIQPQIYDYRI